jgi:hypothetical protein
MSTTLDVDNIIRQAGPGSISMGTRSSPLATWSGCRSR